MGKRLQNQESEAGNILVASMLLLLVMSLMGVALVQTAMKNSRTASVKTIDSEVFHITESCRQESMNWIRAQTQPPDASNLPHVIARANLNHLLVGNETQAISQKLQGYGYGCTITSVAIQSANADGSGAGSDVGMSGGYGASGDLTPKYYYQVDATGTGPQGASKRIVTLVSLQY